MAYLTIKEIAETLGVHEDLVRRWVRQERLYAFNDEHGQRAILRIGGKHVEIQGPWLDDLRSNYIFHKIVNQVKEGKK